jgi:hypothetical protein
MGINKQECRGENEPLKNMFLHVRLDVLMAVTVKNTSFWDVEACSVVKVYRRS